MPMPVALLVLSPILVLAVLSAILMFSVPTKVFAQAEIPVANLRLLAVLGTSAAVMFMMVIVMHDGYYWIKAGSIAAGYNAAGATFIRSQTSPVLGMCLGVPLLAVLYLHARERSIKELPVVVRVGFLWRFVVGWLFLILSMTAYMGLNSLPWRSAAWVCHVGVTVALFIHLGMMSRRARPSRAGILWPLPYALAGVVAIGMLLP